MVQLVVVVAVEIDGILWAVLIAIAVVVIVVGHSGIDTNVAPNFDVVVAIF